LPERQGGRCEVRTSWYSPIHVAIAFVKLFSWGEITKGTTSVTPRDGQAGQLPGAPTYEEQYDVPGIIWIMTPVNSGFHK